MYKVINFSHPLSDVARAQLSERVQDEVDEVMVPVHIDFDKPIKPQFDELVEIAIHELPFDAVIPPALSYAAAYVTARLAEDEAKLPDLPAIIVLKRDDSIPPRFVLADIVK